MMKYLTVMSLIVCGFVLSFEAPSFAQDSGGERVIVIEEKEVSRREAKPDVFVESGTDVIMGEPVENLKAAYRTWKTACDQWKSEIKTNNKKNLLIASCGSPARKEERVKLETVYSFSSQASYKIKVGCQ